jgi:hypothetical protein
MNFPDSIKVRIEVPGRPAWFATSPKHKATPEETVVHLNELAKLQGTEVTYTLASQKEYAAYMAPTRRRNKT